MAITAGMVKELREMTGAGMMDCKKALTETNGDFDKAVEFLREKGLATAQKKAGRIAAEGIVATGRVEMFLCLSSTEVISMKYCIWHFKKNVDVGTELRSSRLHSKQCTN